MRFLFLLCWIPLCAGFHEEKEDAYTKDIKWQLQQAEKFFCQKDFKMASEHYEMAYHIQKCVTVENQDYAIRTMMGQLYTSMIIEENPMIALTLLNLLLKHIEYVDGEIRIKLQEVNF